MKKFILTLIFSFSVILAFSQSRSVTVEFQKVKRDAIEVNLPFPAKTVIAAIKDSLKKMGYKSKDVKDFIVFNGVKLNSLGPDSYDLYFSVERMSKKEKESSVVQMMISKNFDNFLTVSSDASVMNNAKIFLDSIRNLVVAFDLEQQIIEQDELVAKNDKMMRSLIADGEEFEKKKQKAEEQISENIKNKEKLKTEIELQKQVLETLKGKRSQ